MKRWKLMCSLLLVLVIIGGMFAGCSKSSEPAKNGDDSKKASDKPVEITWWNYPTWDLMDGEVGKYEKEIIKSFNKKYPNIKVNLELIAFQGGPEKVNAAIASKSAPDMIYDYPGRILDYGKKGHLAKLNDMVDDTFKKDVSDSIWKQCMAGDAVYMYPVNVTPFMMAANKTLFEKIGALDLLPLNKPERRWTTEEYTKALQAVKEKAPGVYPSGFFAKNAGGDQGTRAYLENLYGSKFVSDDMSKLMINDENGVKALQWVVDGVKNGIVVPNSEALLSNDNLDLFMQGKMATTIIYSTVLKKIYSTKKTVQFDEVFLPWPTPEGKDPRFEPFIGGMCVFDNGDPAKVDAAKKLVDFIANDPEWQKKNLTSTGGFSVRDSIKGLYDDPEMAYVESMKKYVTDAVTRADGFVEMRTVWFPELQRALMNKATPKEALDSFVQKADAIFAKAKQK